ncbi:MAG: lysophospholipid acyltransferase family protein [Niameybacter sp.]
MLRGIWVLWTMGFHYLTFTSKRKKYRVDNKALDCATKQAYRAKIYEIMRELSRRMIRAAGTELVIKGKENLPEHGPVVYMANHKGLYDSPIMATLIDKDPAIFIGKDVTKKMPVIGDWFDAMGCIYIVRDDMKQSMKAILDGIDELKQGQSVVIFPEGTRQKGPEMGSFKAGSFKLATKANVPIVPIAIQNSYKVLEEKKWIQKATVYVNVGKPIDVAALTAEEKKKLPQHVEDIVRALLAEITE